MSTIDTKPERRVNDGHREPGLRCPASRSDATVSCDAPRGSVGPTTITASRAGSTDASMRAEQAVERSSSAIARSARRSGRVASRAAASNRTRSESSTSTTRAAGPRLAERREVGRGVDRDTERMRRRPLQQT